MREGKKVTRVFRTFPHLDRLHAAHILRLRPTAISPAATTVKSGRVTPQSKLAVFFDDILVFSSTAEQHIKDVATTLYRLFDAGLTAYPSKCKFARAETNFLGFIVSPEGIKPNPETISAVVDFPVPRGVRDVRSFLSLCSYYRRFVKGFPAIAGPLTKLLCKTQRWEWNEDQNRAFENLKAALIPPTVLAFQEPNKGAHPLHRRQQI